MGLHLGTILSLNPIFKSKTHYSTYMLPLPFLLSITHPLP